MDLALVAHPAWGAFSHQMTVLMVAGKVLLQSRRGMAEDRNRGEVER